MKTDHQDISKHIIGTCLGMCPNAELRMRQRERLLHPLERSIDPRGGTGRAEPRAMVKEFSRSAAGHHIKPSDVRPLPILIKTTKYLLTNVCCREDTSWALIYQFVFDRLRAIRQDLCVQDIREAGLGVLQAAVRFYVYAQYRTCEHDLCDFDPYLNMKHLAETLSLVITLYQESANEKNAVESRNICGREDISSFVQCDICDKSSDESSYSDDSESDDVNESKITQDAVASEKTNNASKGAPESEGSGTDTTRNEERGERWDCDEGSGSSQASSNDLCKNTNTATMMESGGVDEEQETQQEREEQQRREREKDKEEQQRREREKDKEEQQRREREKDKEEEQQKREKKREKLRCEMLKYSPREEAEALNLLVNFGQAEAIMHVLKLPREIRESRLVWTALQMNLAWVNNNYYRVLCLAPLLPPLCLVAFYYHLTAVQRRALSILSCGHSSRGGLMYSGEDLVASLRFPSITTLFDACTHYGLNTTHTGVIFTKASFNHEAPLMKTTRVGWIDERLTSVSLGDLLLPQSQDLLKWLAG
ncbi:hypothetical protein Pcinc_006726 [Petrolisthes cinctipes]|uniref:SAC3/GANP/THP3 conserved domain-containing protein n=1 Tax=Petrolisthes cinctipes TaxID=88211 RepID=A0AAE1KXZ5_PETCI|nr:hypothetical protein Pcinc_006726 [Petrolisthes cinctipes]